LELTWRVFGIQAEIFAVCLASSSSAHLHLLSQSFLPLAWWRWPIESPRP